MYIAEDKLSEKMRPFLPTKESIIYTILGQGGVELIPFFPGFLSAFFYSHSFIVPVNYQFQDKLSSNSKF